MTSILSIGQRYLERHFSRDLRGGQVRDTRRLRSLLRQKR
jgi:hypothetical protein